MKNIIEATEILYLSTFRENRFIVEVREGGKCLCSMYNNEEFDKLYELLGSARGFKLSLVEESFDDKSKLPLYIVKFN